MYKNISSKDNTVLKTPPYYHREYGDVKKKEEKQNLYARVLQASLPFISLYKPFNKVFTLCLDGAKVVHSFKDLKKALEDKNYNGFSKAVVNSSIASASVFFTLIAHPLGMMIATSKDTLYSASDALKALHGKEYKKALEHLLKTANNGLYLTTFISGSAEVIVLSLLIQIATHLKKALEEHRKGNHLEAIANLAMGSIRYKQMQPYAKTLKAKGYKNLFRSVDIYYESTIQEILGEEYLSFNENDPREKYLILNSTADHNGAFDPSLGTFCEDLERLNKYYDIKFCSVSSIQEINNKINLAAQAGKVSGLMLRAHGCDEYMIFGDCNSGIFSKDTINSEMFEKLDSDCVIILDSCSTAIKYLDSIAYDVSRIANKVVVAACDILYAEDICLVNEYPFEWTFGDKTIEIDPCLFETCVA